MVNKSIVRWRSLESRKAHNLKIAGSNPARTTLYEAQTFNLKIAGSNPARTTLYEAQTLLAKIVVRRIGFHAPINRNPMTQS